MTASHHAEVEALLVRLSDMRRLSAEMAKERQRLDPESSVAEDLFSVEQVLGQAEKLLRKVRGHLET